MRTPTLTVLLASLLAVGCAPIGSAPGRDRGTDAGAGDAGAACDNMTTKTMDLEFSGSASSSIPSGCWSLAGTLTIDSSVSSLAKLGDLRSVTALVLKSTQLAKIDTPNAIAVTDSIDIENNTKLADVSNLSVPAAASSGACAYLSAVTVTGNPALTSLGPLNQLSCVSGPTVISNNTALTDIDLGQVTRLEGGLTIAGNTEATSLELTALASETGAIAITGNTALTSLGTWTALQFVHGSLTIQNNAALTSLGTWTALTSIEGALTIQNNAALTSLGTWTALDSVLGAVTIDSNPALASLSGVLPAVGQDETMALVIGGTLTITNDGALADVGDFDHIGQAASVNVSSNAKLTYCKARNVGCCVRTTSGTATITGNEGGTTCNDGTKSWCYADDNSCHNDYTGYTGNVD